MASGIPVLIADGGRLQASKDALLGDLERKGFAARLLPPDQTDSFYSPVLEVAARLSELISEDALFALISVLVTHATASKSDVAPSRVTIYGPSGEVLRSVALSNRTRKS